MPFFPLAAEAAQPVAELVVTAARTPATADEITGARIVGRSEIEARQAVLATDVLETLPGVSIARSGAFGGLTAIRLRGMPPDKTLVLIDGLPVGDPSDPSGAYDFAVLQVADIERVELLTGPQSSLWGSEAIGGVISLTSRELDGLRAEGEAGSYSTFRGTLAAGTRGEKGAVSAFVTGLTSDGITKADRGVERDGIDTWTASASARLRLSPRLELEARARRVVSDVDADGYPFPDFLLGDAPDRAKSRSWTGAVKARLEDPWGLRHEASFSLYDLTRKAFSDFPYHYTAERQVWRWTVEKGEASDRLAFTLGAERQENDADLSDGSRFDLSATSAFAVGRFRPSERLTLIASLRRDEPDDVPGRTTGRASAAFMAGGGFTVTASAGTGFKTPTISQLACDFCFPSGPASGLKPETAEGYDLRLAWRDPEGRVRAAVTGFRLSVKDQISYVAGRYVNIARVESQGLEAEAEVKLSGPLSARLGYALIEADDRAADLRLIRTPRHSGAAELLWQGERLEGALTLRAESSQADTDIDGFSRISRRGFVVADIAAAWRLTERVQVTGRIENLFDRRYQESFGYREPGLSAYLGLRLRL